MIRALAAAALLAACGEAVPDRLPDDYTTWPRREVSGQAPGHGDTYRIIYANPVAADPAMELVGGYPPGSILVKEIYDAPGGALDYIAIMRRNDPEPTPRPSEEGGWLFTETDTPGGAETHFDYCWRRCHVAAPYNGAWYDYRKIVP